MAIWSAEIKEIEKLYQSLGGRLPGLEKELEQLIKTDDANVIMLYSRRCLEVIIIDLCECELKRPRKTEPLKGIIDKLNSEEKVPSHIITSMHGLNSLSTYGTHPKDFDPEQVKPTLSNLSIVLKWYFRYKDSQTVGKIKAEETENKQSDIPISAKHKSKKIKYFIPAAIILLIFVIAYPRIFKKDKLDELRSSEGRISIAVMPFMNQTNDTIWNIWQDGIQTNLIAFLSNNSKELKVKQKESIAGLIQSRGLTNYTSLTPSVASIISQKLDANVYIYGSINQAGSTIRLNAQLSDSKTQETFKSFQIDGSPENIILMIDSLSTALTNFLLISKMEKEAYPAYKFHANTNSPDAYRFYLLGQKAFDQQDFPRAKDWFIQAITLDSNYVGAILYLSQTYQRQYNNEDAKKWCLKAYAKRDQMPILDKLTTNMVYAQYFETPNEEIKCWEQILEIDDQVPKNIFLLGCAYYRLKQYDRAISKFEKALEMLNKFDLKPEFFTYYTNLGYAYHKTGEYKKEKKLYKNSEQYFPDNLQLTYCKAILSLTEGDTVTANQYIEKRLLQYKGSSEFKQIKSSYLARLYDEAGMVDKAEGYYRNMLLLVPKNPWVMNNVGYFLIDHDRNINEGLELVNKALELSPDNYIFLDTKGWGLYKQGKYQEALETLQRSWDLRRQNVISYDHEAFLHLEAAKKAVANQQNN